MVLIAYTPCEELQSRGTLERRSPTTHIGENHAPESEFERDSGPAQDVLDTQQRVHKPHGRKGPEDETDAHA